MQVTNAEISSLARFAVDAVRGAGEIALRYYGKGRPELKFDDEVVTEAELRLVDYFRTKLESNFSEHAVYGDQLSPKSYVHGQGGYLWIYDALDGTANFQAGIPIWGTSLALLENYWPILGVFYMPVTGDLFFAEAGQKASHGERTLRIPAMTDVSNESVLLTYSRFHNQYDSTFPGKIRNLGSTAAHICYVAQGRAEGALLAHLSCQDLAAAQIILKAAGGEIYKMDGTEFHLGDYLREQRIDEHLLVTPKGSFSAVRMYLQDKD